jgi:hypothetical protein
MYTIYWSSRKKWRQPRIKEAEPKTEWKRPRSDGKWSEVRGNGPKQKNIEGKY